MTPKYKYGEVPLDGIERGNCEVHGDWCNHLRVVRIPQEKATFMLPQNQLEEDFVSNAMVVCAPCRKMLRELTGGADILDAKINEDILTLPIVEKSQLDPTIYRAIRKFAEIKTIFPGEIREIYVVPDEKSHSISDSDGCVNIVVAFNSLSILSYTNWVLREKKSAMFLWADKQMRTRFFTAKMMRIFIELSRIHLNKTAGLRIWVGSYTRFVSMDFFCGNPVRMSQLYPRRLLKVI